MDFKEFFKKFYKGRNRGKLKNLNSQGDIVEFFLEGFLTEEEIRKILPTSNDSFIKYFNGKRSIRKETLEMISSSLKLNEFTKKLFDKIDDNFMQDIALDFGIRLKSDEKPNKHKLAYAISVQFIELARKKGIADNIVPSEYKKEQPLADDEFADYLKNAKEKYSKVRTLLFRYEPYPFYEFYVTNSLERRTMNPCNCGTYDTYKIDDVNVNVLSDISNFIIITGVGGLGKSMMMKHLLLDSIEQYRNTKKLPIFISLNNYRLGTENSNLFNYVYNNFEHLSVKNTTEDLEKLLQSGRCIILFDGFDEISWECRTVFEAGLENFTDKYSKNLFIVSSRTIMRNSAFNRFSVIKLLPFDKNQAIELIKKLPYRTDEPNLKNMFLKKLDSTLFETHKSFVQNPLLLTIMLMTFEQFGGIQSKIHLFYREAYETLAKKHDAHKVGYTREFKTGLTYDKFADYFADFCAVTYCSEKYKFTKDEVENIFNGMNICQEETPSFTYEDFLYDSCMCMCLMFYEGGEYQFIHRSFQEYFSARFFSKQMDDKLYDIAKEVFEKIDTRAEDKTFAMMYDMIPKKVERFIFLPYLKDLQKQCILKEGYWTYLEKMHPTVHYEHGETYEPIDNINEANSFLCRFILSQFDTQYLSGEMLPFYDEFIVEKYAYFDPNFEILEDENGEDFAQNSEFGTELYPLSELPVNYDDYFDYPEIVGWDLQFEISEIRQNSDKYKKLLEILNDDSFAFKQEYNKLLAYMEELEEKFKQTPRTGNLFERLR